ncbi:MAG: hypothetical protein EOP11_18370 [Proteobacteria bacterium]|nr:MAG: hypothetical protein EOP11_18370 [Pseudomonadota bacterium]
MRGFLGFKLADEFAREVESFVAGWPLDPALRPTLREDLHVTVKFLSEFSSSVFFACLPELIALGPAPVAELRVGRLAIWPTVVALECEASEELREWHGRVNALLERRGFIHERHPLYHPHITLARRRGRPGMPVGELHAETNAALLGAADFFAGRVVSLRPLSLFQSQAEETGRRHRAILSPLYPA